MPPWQTQLQQTKQKRYGRQKHKPLNTGIHIMSIDNPQFDKLTYTIQDFSSHSASYHPRNIMECRPWDQSSRWSSGTNNQMQYITLKLDNPAIVLHVCNLKEFKVLGGMTPTKLTELVHSGLRNDTDPETFYLKYMDNNVIFPIQYIKIVPLMAWGANFNFSIWYIEMMGINAPNVVQRAQREYDEYQEIQTIKLCLKHFRERDMNDVFELLSRRTNIQLEDPLLTRLHHTLVMDADFDEAERIISTASEEGLFASYLRKCDYTPVWQNVKTGEDIEPICSKQRYAFHLITFGYVEGGLIYLLGGWNGKMDLSDFWSYSIKDRQWTMISSNTSKNYYWLISEGGPGPRSCHKICFDPSSRSIYVLGRYVESQQRVETNLYSDFYQYMTHLNRWVRLSENTALEGGPDLIYDHQMCMDNEKQMLYVFGGRTVHPDATQHHYSGLYRYCANTHTWELLRADIAHHQYSPPTPPVDNNNRPESNSNRTTPVSNTSSPSRNSPPATNYGRPRYNRQPFSTLKSRVGHSMLYDPDARLLYIFAGQRLKDYLSDFYAYSIDRDEFTEISRDYSQQSGPDAGFTQRATIDYEKQEIYILSGYMKVKGHDMVKNSFWVYDIRTNVWKKVYQNEAPKDDERIYSDTEPCPRFAHQLVYDHLNKVQYLFGGNPGDIKDITKRLDDFWELRLIRPDAKDILRQCLFQIRSQKFLELCQKDLEDSGIEALQYLQNDLSQVVDHSNPTESAEFRQLSSKLVMGVNQGKAKSYNFQSARSELFEKLLQYFPDNMKQPDGSLIDAIRIV
ncbi:hypothetical protein INT43_001412 [Umbelopsis isabellina]|uniref:Muskelin N-terminal domain-containing protein n=1 Tax=Mortierella isabellina TaxID=91625 RepID=A0A8H7U6U2_MORIS|nr:hypothetical protein INT43_001412 [Umbelopsis isabellina]